jgi:hypothetical protein
MSWEAQGVPGYRKRSQDLAVLNAPGLTHTRRVAQRTAPRRERYCRSSLLSSPIATAPRTRCSLSCGCFPLTKPCGKLLQGLLISRR